MDLCAQVDSFNRASGGRTGKIGRLFSGRSRSSPKTPNTASPVKSDPPTPPTGPGLSLDDMLIYQPVSACWVLVRVWCWGRGHICDPATWSQRNAVYLQMIGESHPAHMSLYNSTSCALWLSIMRACVLDRPGVYTYVRYMPCHSQVPMCPVQKTLTGRSYGGRV